MNEEEWYEQSCEQDARTPYKPQTTLTPAELAGEDEEPEEWFGYDIDRLHHTPRAANDGVGPRPGGGAAAILRSSTRNRDMKTFVTQSVTGNNASAIIVGVRPYETAEATTEGALTVHELYARVTGQTMDGEPEMGYWRDAQGQQVCGDPNRISRQGGTMSGTLSGWQTHASKDELISAAKQYVKKSKFANKAALLSELEKF